jgi:hypothetical protein
MDCTRSTYGEGRSVSSLHVGMSMSGSASFVVDMRVVIKTQVGWRNK